MMLTNRFAILGFLAAVLTASLALVQISVYWESVTGSTILWNRDQSVAFIQLRRDGLRAPLAVAAWQLIRNTLSLSTKLTASRSWAVALVIRPDAAHAMPLTGDLPSVYSVMDGLVYSGFDKNLLRWNGEEFVPADEVERVRFAERLAGRERSFTDLDGWSSRVNVLSGDDLPFEMLLAGQSTKVAVVSAGGEKAIEVTLANGERMRVLSINEGPTYVRHARYKQLFE